MTTDEVLEIFRQCGAILDGHFILTSGLRSLTFVQKGLRIHARGKDRNTLCGA